MISHARNVMVLYRYATLGAVAGRSRTVSIREVGFLRRTILISLRLQFESRYVETFRNLSGRKASL
jgi:hypothetical protein